MNNTMFLAAEQKTGSLPVCGNQGFIELAINDHTGAFEGSMLLNSMLGLR